MKRIRMFLFFQFMAFASLVKPRIGMEMVSDALDGKHYQALKRWTDTRKGP